MATEPAPSRPLRVGLIAPPWVPVPPTVYGGTRYRNLIDCPLDDPAEPEQLSVVSA
jgi:hypothetical protein